MKDYRFGDEVGKVVNAFLFGIGLTLANEFMIYFFHWSICR